MACTKRRRAPDVKRAVEHADRADDAAVGVVVRVEDQPLERRIGVSGRRGNPVDDRVEQLGDSLAGLRRDTQDVFCRDAEHLLDLTRDPIGLGRREVDLVERGHDGEVVLDGEIAVRQRLGLDPLARVDEQDHPLTGGQTARDLVAEVDVAGGVDQVDDVVVPQDPHVLGLDRDPALPLDVHRVEVLGPHVAHLDGPGQLEEPVGQRRLPVVDVGDDRDAAELFQGGHRRILADGRGDPPPQGRRSTDSCPLVLPFFDRLKVLGAPTRMANIKQQKKRNLQNETRRVRNLAVRTELKTRVKNVRAAIDSDADDKVEPLRMAQKRLDKAGSKGVIHKRQAARRTSRLMKATNKAS